jgi:hypothetical protein
MEQLQNQPRMNSDLHGWDFEAHEGALAAEVRAANSNLPSDPCSI